MPAPRHPPDAPGGHPLVGHTLSFLREPLQTLERVGWRDDGVVQVTIAGQQFVLVTDADEYRKAEIVRENLGTLQGGSLVLLEGQQWHERRGLLQSGFGGESVTAAGPLTTRYARRAVESWPAEIRADERLRSLSLSILARALFGLDLGGERTPIHEAAEDVIAGMDPRTLSAFLPEWVPTPTNYRFQRAVETLHERIDTVVDETEDSPEGNLLSIMLASGLDPEAVRDELIALLFAGYDSTATALACTLGLLGDHPDQQAALRREPTQGLAVGEYAIEEGTTVVLSPWVCQRDPAVWDAPAAFRPQRWHADRERPGFAYVPYGGGPRHCLGRRLADQTLRLVVAVVCQHRRLQLQGELSVSAGHYER